MRTPNRVVTILAAAATIGALVAATFPQYQTVALVAGTIAAVATALGRSLFPDEFPDVPQPPKPQSSASASAPVENTLIGAAQTIIRHAPKKNRD